MRPERGFPTIAGDPLLSETIRAIDLFRSTPDGQIRRILDVQLREAEELVRTCALAQTKWNACIRGSISAAAGKFQTVASKQLLRQLNVGGAAWIDQFPHGFQITGTMSREPPPLPPPPPVREGVR